MDADFRSQDLAMTSQRDESVYDYAPYNASPIVPRHPTQRVDQRVGARVV